MALLPEVCHFQYLRAVQGGYVASLCPKGVISKTLTSRPFGTKRAPLVDAFCKSLFVPDKDAEQLAGEQLLSAPAFLDRMLLVLFDALWLKQSEDWSNRGVANMCAEEPYETADLKRRTSPWPSTTLSEGWVRMLNLLLSVNRIAKWFLRGQNVGRKPLYDGICSQCGCLLYGTVSHNSALSNKVVGPPTNRDGMILTLPDGTVDSAAQPPFLLRSLHPLWGSPYPTTNYGGSRVLGGLQVLTTALREGGA